MGKIFGREQTNKQTSYDYGSIRPRITGISVKSLKGALYCRVKPVIVKASMSILEQLKLV